MKIRKIIIIFSIFFLAGIMEACVQKCDTYYYTYSYTDIEIANLDNSGLTIKIASNSVPKTAYGIRISYQYNETDNYMAQLFRPNLHLVYSAYATSVCHDVYNRKTEEAITSIRIITLNDFDETHSAGADIAHYFKLYRTYKTIDEYLAMLANYREYEERILTNGEDLLLMTSPTKGSMHKFKIQMELSDGRILEKETDEIELI